MSAAATQGPDHHARQVTWSAIRLMGGTGVIGVTYVIFTASISHRFGVETLSEVVTIISLATLLGLVVFGLSQPLATRLISRAHGLGDPELAGFYRWEIVWKATLMACSISGMTAIVAFLPIGSWDDRLLWLSAIVVVPLVMYQTLRGVYLGEENPGAYVAREFSANLALLLTLAIVVIGGFSSLALIPVIVLHITFVVLSRRHLRRPKQPRTVLERSDYTYAILALGASLAVFARQHVGTLFSAAYLDAQAIAVFSVAAFLVSMVMIVPGAIGNALAPRLSHLHGAAKESEAHATAGQMFQTMTLLATPVFLLSIALAPLAIEFAYGLELSKAASSAIGLMVVGGYMPFTGRAAVSASHASGRIRLAAGVSVASMLVAVTVWAIFGRTLGLLGMAIGYTTPWIVTSTFFQSMTLPGLGVGLKDRIPNLSGLLLVSSVAIAGFFTNVWPWAIGMTIAYGLAFHRRYRGAWMWIAGRTP